MPSWDSAAADELWTEACGKERWLGTTETVEQDIRRISDASLWQLRTDGQQVPRRIRPRAIVPATGRFRRIARGG